jgi:DNA-binding transcriptional MocR family regulator
MKIEIQLDPAASAPLYRQLADGIAGLIRDGRLEAGQRLPTVRELAGQLGVTRPTIHRAFRELQARGWLEATVGRGTFVRREPARTAGLEGELAGGLTPDEVIGDLQAAGGEGRFLNLAHAEPDAEMAPAGEFWDCLTDLKHEAADLMRYVSPQGDRALREELSRHLRERNIQAGPEEILVTDGVTQALSLVARVLARPGDRVAVEEPTYLGLLHILEAEGLRPVGVPMDGDGPRLDLLERVLVQEQPRFFYTIASFQNPTGGSMSEARRRDLLALAEQRGLLVVEDDIYHRLAYDSPPPPALKSLDRDGLVIYLDGLSKAALPGARLGYAVPPPALRERLLSMRRAADLCGSLPLQRAAAVFLRRDGMRHHLRNVLPEYRRRRNALLRELEEGMPASVRWTRPGGGFSCWITLPAGVDPGDLYQATRARGLLVAPGEVFLVDRSDRRFVRLCFGAEPEEKIREGVGLLAGLVRQRLARGTAPRQPAVERAPLV